jgi:hypothetical protein
MLFSPNFFKLATAFSKMVSDLIKVSSGLRIAAPKMANLKCVGTRQVALGA